MIHHVLVKKDYFQKNLTGNFIFLTGEYLTYLMFEWNDEVVQLYEQYILDPNITIHLS